MLLLANWKLDFKESTFSCTVSVGTTESVGCKQKLVFLKLIKGKPFKLDINAYTVLSSPASLMVYIIIIIIIKFKKKKLRVNAGYVNNMKKLLTT
jgi:hypothetical protein